jgi:hypothetical protein
MKPPLPIARVAAIVALGALAPGAKAGVIAETSKAVVRVVVTPDEPGLRASLGSGFKVASRDVASFLRANGEAPAIDEPPCGNGGTAKGDQSPQAPPEREAGDGGMARGAGMFFLIVLVILTVAGGGYWLYGQLREKTARESHAQEARDSDEW